MNRFLCRSTLWLSVAPDSGSTIYAADGRIVSESRNLRGIVRRSSAIRAAHPCDTREPWRVDAVTIWQAPRGSARLVVNWRDGSQGNARFASAQVCRQFCAARRDWPAAKVVTP